MNEIPPKHTPDDMPPSGGNLVSVYQAASGANSESFPVLKAFQDYIEAERAQARKRVVSLSIFFAVIICVVVGGFLATGIYLLRDRAQLQDKLFDLAFAPRTPAETPQPVYVTPPAPAPQAGLDGETVKELSKEVIAAVQAGIGKQIDGVSEISQQVHEKVSAQETEMEKLRQALSEMKEQNEQLKGDVETMLADAAQPPPQPEVAPAVAPAAEATAVAEVATAPAPAPVAAPPAAPVLKEPPVTPDGVKPPDAPKGMMATTLPLNSKSNATIPWRVIIPE